MQHSNLNPVSTRPDLQTLGARLDGDLVTPADELWDEARRPWNLAVDQHPVAVVLADSAQDVVATIEYAHAAGLAVAPQGTGHGAAPLDLDSTILLKTSRLRGVEINPVDRIARVEAGVLWLEVVQAAAEHGLAALSGSSPDVGVVGYTLGGGLSWLSRSFGLAANSVTAVELVTADGRLVRADRDQEPDLFWALRGGGGSFGVVTALEFRLFPLAEVYAGMLFWPVEEATRVLNAWREWIEVVPDAMTSVGRILNLPPIPEIPQALRGRSFVVVETIYLGDEAVGAELVRPLRALAPELDTVAMISLPQLSHLHMDPEQPVPGAGDGLLLDGVTPQTIEAFVTGTVGSPLLSAELRHLGGALAEGSQEHGALASVDADFALFTVGIAPTPEAKEAIEGHVGELLKSLSPWDAGSMYLNFAETKRAARTLWSEQAYHRLRRVKARYDAGDLIRSNHPVPVA